MRNLVCGSLLCVVMTGCGGGGNGGSPSTPTTDTPPDNNSFSITIYGDEDVVVGDVVELAVTADNGVSLDTVSWQSEDPAIELLAAHTQVIGFDATAPGNYPVSVSVTDASGNTTEASVTVRVTQGSAPSVRVRIGREASELGRVTLYADVTDYDTVSDIRWEQVSGPAILNLSYDDGSPSHSVYFQAPEVNQDSMVTMRATVTFSDGSTASDDSMVVVRNIDYATNAFMVSDRNDDNILETVSARMMPYRADSPYANALVNCTYSNTQARSCSFSALPMLGSETESPSVEDVLNRTLVSHPWMGDVFADYLRNDPAAEDMLSLLRATTAVVISYDIRPSFYWTATGAIYLDANNFWQTPSQRDTLDRAPDYRSGFGSDLNYTSGWRYVKDGEYYFPQPAYPLEARLTRPASGVSASLTRLMYHELAHANDFFDYTIWSQLRDDESPLGVYNASQGNINSNALDDALPLTSQELHALASVRYRGNDASPLQQSYDAQMVAGWFEDDTAVSDYSYLTIREDYAMLVERFMMLYRLGVSADDAYFTRETAIQRNYDITWGQRNRISVPDVTQRAIFALERILPSLNAEQAAESLLPPVALPTGESWFDTVSLAAESAGQVDSGTVTSGQQLPPMPYEHAPLVLQGIPVH
ncbi:hypothetical protein [Alteromonas sp. CYL-A6]|uniref:hypothetical protein n=1 Tax=Alteromonas nitratireducens TaxID=3390813 RepID=UPI0034BA9994